MLSRVTLVLLAMQPLTEAVGETLRDPATGLSVVVPDGMTGEVLHSDVGTALEVTGTRPDTTCLVSTTALSRQTTQDRINAGSEMDLSRYAHDAFDSLLQIDKIIPVAHGTVRGIAFEAESKVLPGWKSAISLFDTTTARTQVDCTVEASGFDARRPVFATIVQSITLPR